MAQQYINEAQQIIISARNAKANDYAPAELANADSALADAIEQMKQGNNSQAIALVMKAKDFAESAIRISKGKANFSGAFMQTQKSTTSVPTSETSKSKRNKKVKKT